MSGDEPNISRRKADHLALAASGEVDFRGVSTLLEDVRLVHQALPELSADEIDLATTIAGRRILAPVVVSGMTGGTAPARDLNRDLARAAEKLGLAFGLGSQRAMALHPELTPTFQVRDAAPSVFLLGNIGVVTARELGVERVRELVHAVDANALCVHLNPAMELVQDEGDRDFRGGLEVLRRLVDGLDVPVIAKETGCGLSREAARALKEVGIRTVDVSGAGGTSWVGIEARRAAAESPGRTLGEELWDWGVPTAVSVALCAAEGLEIIATGGLRSGHDVARALALGAKAGGLAAPVLRAHRKGGYVGVVQFLEGVVASVRAVTLLTACRSSRDLAHAPRVVTGELRQWLFDLGVGGSR
ncbi:MAG: type 2 isopentenyl-diphosphate Delta-isomerase [Deltaproteobacteria bacterium]|nr:type 2 isopentenyl-diphosphate Delta-isomerase [Deltaproteobacteria bacterium]